MTVHATAKNRSDKQEKDDDDDDEDQCPYNIPALEVEQEFLVTDVLDNQDDEDVKMNVTRQQNVQIGESEDNDTNAAVCSVSAQSIVELPLAPKVPVKHEIYNELDFEGLDKAFTEEGTWICPKADCVEFNGLYH